MKPPKIFTLKGQGVIIPKARPIVNTDTKIAFLPESYRQWKNKNSASLGRQWEFIASNKVAELFEIELILDGNHRDYADIDNILGSILDALKDAKIIIDDKMRYLRRVIAEYLPSEEPPVYTLFLTVKKFKDPPNTDDSPLTDLNNPF